MKNPQVDLTFPDSDMCEINTSPPATWRVYSCATADDDKSARNIIGTDKSYIMYNMMQQHSVCGVLKRKKKEKSVHSCHPRGYPWLIEINDVLLCYIYMCAMYTRV